MSFDTFLLWLQESSIAVSIREGDNLFPWIECVHVLALTIVVGSIAIVDLRLLGWASRDRSISALTGEVLPFTWIAFVAAAITGLLLFSSNAVKYAHNLPFQIKMLFLILAGMNMSFFHIISRLQRQPQNAFISTPWTFKLSGALSLLLWISIVAFGRWIGFTMTSLT